MKFIRFTEHNDHEGENWDFWLQLDDNEKELDKLSDLIARFDDNEESYEIDFEPIDESEVDTLVKYGGQGYMDYHTKCAGKFICPTTNTTDEEVGWEFLNDNFYKGQIANCFN